MFVMEPSLLPDLPRHRITLREWHAMIEAGVFGKGDRVELIEGTIVPMSPDSKPHRAVITRLTHALVSGSGQSFMVQVQSSLTLGEGNEPEPDLCVLPVEEVRLTAIHADHPVLCVEVAVSSLTMDRTKTRIYAWHGVPEVWVVNVLGRTIEVYREPDLVDGRYRRVDIVSTGTLGAERLPAVAVDIEALFR